MTWASENVAQRAEYLMHIFWRGGLNPGNSPDTPMNLEKQYAARGLLIQKHMKALNQVLIGFWIGVSSVSCTVSTNSDNPPHKTEGYWELEQLVTRYYHQDSLLLESSVDDFPYERLIKFDGSQAETIDGTKDTCYSKSIGKDVIYKSDSVFRYTTDPNNNVRSLYKAYGIGNSDSILVYENGNNPNYWCPRLSCIYFDAENAALLTFTQAESSQPSHIKITLSTNRFIYRRINHQRYAEYLGKGCRSVLD